LIEMTLLGLPNVARWESASRVIYEKAAMIRPSTEPGCGQGRLGLCDTRSPRFHSGIVRPVESAVKRTRKPRLYGGASLRCSYRLVVSTGITTWQPCLAIPAIKPAAPAGRLVAHRKRAPSAMWESSHRTESPRPAGCGEMRALALLPPGGSPRRQYLGQSVRRTPIIAPGREGSQLWGACPDMVEGCSHDPGLSDGLVMVRGGWVL
jgi:hypothetical protein